MERENSFSTLKLEFSNGVFEQAHKERSCIAAKVILLALQPTTAMDHQTLPYAFHRWY
jgi:hypothetical protein